MTLRRYITGEETQIWGVYYRATHETNAADYHTELLNRWAPPDMDMTQWACRLRETNPFVALLDDQIVGFAELDASGFLEYFYVTPDHQRQGVGKALMSKLISEAYNLGVTAVTADVSITSKNFFLAHGFEIVESRMNIIMGHPAPNFSMIRQLPAP